MGVRECTNTRTRAFTSALASSSADWHGPLPASAPDVREPAAISARQSLPAGLGLQRSWLCWAHTVRRSEQILHWAAPSGTRRQNYSYTQTRKANASTAQLAQWPEYRPADRMDPGSNPGGDFFTVLI